MLLEEETRTATAPALAPAVVRRTEGRRVRVALGRDEVWAEIALAFPYRPVAGDRVLVIGQADEHYVIGLLQASGPTHWSFPGDVELIVPHGALTLTSGKGVTVKGPVVTLRAERLETVARTVVQKCSNAYHRVRELLQVSAGRTRTQVEGTSIHKAERTWVLSAKETKIDGEKVLLG